KRLRELLHLYQELRPTGSRDLTLESTSDRQQNGQEPRDYAHEILRELAIVKRKSTINNRQSVRPPVASGQAAEAPGLLLPIGIRSACEFRRKRVYSPNGRNGKARLRSAPLSRMLSPPRRRL